MANEILGTRDLINKTKNEWLVMIAERQGEPELVEKMMNCYEHHLSQHAKEFQDYVLQQDFDWFGRQIPKGTLYIQVNEDDYMPSIDGARIPTMTLDFYTVKNNKEWFLPFSWHS